MLVAVYRRHGFNFSRVLKHCAVCTHMAICVAFSPSVDLHLCFYIAVLTINFFLECHQWLFRADRDLNLNISNFHCFWALGVGSGTLPSPHVLAWRKGSDYSDQIASELFDLPSFFLELSKILKKRRPAYKLFKAHPQVDFKFKWLDSKWHLGVYNHSSRLPAAVFSLLQSTMRDTKQIGWNTSGSIEDSSASKIVSICLCSNFQY